MRRHRKWPGPQRRGRFWHTWEQQEAAFEENSSSAWAGMERGRAWHQHMHTYLGRSPEEHWLFGGRRFRPWMSGKWGAPETFNPFVAEVMSQGGGLLALYVLYLISSEPRYGNDIMKVIEERTAGRWMANPGAIYPLLNTLEESDFIRGEWESPEKRSRRIYTVTSEGTAELERLASVMVPMIVEAVEVLQSLHADIESVLGEEEQESFDPEGTGPEMEAE